MSAPVDGDARRQDVAQREIAKLISELESSRLQGRQLSTTDHLLTLRRLAEHGRILTLELLLPVALRLNGAPYHLQDHFPFSPVFKVQMPKNLVIKSGRQLSKSTSLASHGILLANCIPNFRTLFVTPLYEQIRRFSNNYVRPFIDQSPIKSLWSNTGTENSVLQRSFRNLSTMIFSFALLDADRVRGVSADRVGIDECSPYWSLLITPEGPRRICDVRPGEAVQGFDDNGNVVWTHVLKQWYAGRRRCYRLHTRGGKHVDLTAESFVATDAGCIRVSTLVAAIRRWQKQQLDPKAAADGTATAVDLWDATRRRAPDGEAKQPLSGSAMLSTTRLPLAKVHDIARVRTWDTVGADENETRLQVGRFLDCRHAGVYLLTHPLVSGREEADLSGDSGSHRQDGPPADGRMVVCRRRQSLRSRRFSDDDFLYARVPASRGRAFMPLADGSWLSVASLDATSTELPPIPDYLCDGRRGRSPNGGSPALYAAQHALQVATYWEERYGDVYVLRDTVPAFAASPPHRSAVVSVLRGQRLLEAATTPRLPALHGQAGCPREACRASAHTVPDRRDFQAERAAVQPRVAEVAPGGQQAAQKALSRQAASSTSSSDAAMQYLRTTADAAGPRSHRPQSLPGMSARVHATQGQGTVASEEASLRLVPDELIGIEPIDPVDVYDVETAGTHSIIVDGIGTPQCQDMDPDHIPIIRETMSYSKYGLMQFTGTPKSLDNPLEGLWQQSSQAEWFIPCFNCGEWNIPSLEYHLDRMIGPFHELISERRPGTVCHKCQRPINPRQGHWLHRYPDKAQHFAGYHIPQLLLPLHYARPDKWNELLLKREGWGNTSLNTFYNEVLGESVDVGQKLVTETELKRACRLPWKNNPNEPAAIVRSRLKHYKMRVLAADWGGGGEKGVSFTVLTLLGFTPTGEIHCLWGKRLLSGGDHLREARECIHWVRVFGADLFAHDYTGAGWVRETVLVQAGFDLERVMGMNYCRTAARNLIQYVPPSPLHQRAHYNLDKARSILYTCQAIKLGLLSFFEWDKESNDNQGLINDFLAMVEEKTESRSAGDIYVITKNPTLTDDFAQAVNIGAAALWHANKAWPNFAQAASVARINQSVIQAAGSSEWGWDEDRSMSGYLNQP